LKYAHENGCNWNEQTCLNAATFGELECLKYAHENGCSWDGDETTGFVVGDNRCRSACDMAVLQKKIDCFMYAFERHCRWRSFTISSTWADYREQYFRILRCALQQIKPPQFFLHPSDTVSMKKLDHAKMCIAVSNSCQLFREHCIFCEPLLLRTLDRAILDLFYLSATSEMRYCCWPYNLTELISSFL